MIQKRKQIIRQTQMQLQVHSLELFILIVVTNWLLTPIFYFFIFPSKSKSFLATLSNSESEIRVFFVAVSSSVNNLFNFYTIALS